MSIDAIEYLDRRQRYTESRLARADRRKEPQVQFTPVGDGADEYMRHEDLWFEDETVLVIAKNVRFRLHRGVLAKFSTVFRDMFQIADASAGSSMQGCPTVEVTDDPEHLALFFTLLYDGGRQYVKYETFA